MVTLYNVVDIRNNQFHSIAIVKERNVKWYVPEKTKNTNEENVETNTEE